MDALSEHESEPTSDRHGGAAQARVLMVDDHPDNLLALEAILSPLGHPLVRAQSADEAFRQLLHGEFAVILMDVQMPGLDGFAAASLIKQRERTRGIPIIFITALSRDTQFVFQGYEHGAVDYILKPVEPTILRSKVTVFADLYLQKQEIQRQGQLLLEEKERSSMRRYRALSDSLPVSVWVTDREGRVTYRNKRVRDAYNRNTSEPFDWLEKVHADDRARVRATWQAALEQRISAETELRLREGQEGTGYCWQVCNIVPDAEVDGGCIIAATDISVQKAAQETAEAANRLKDEFLATVSHELRTPLNAILGWTQNLLETGAAAQEMRHALEAIERNARSQSELIGDILDVSRIVTGKLILSPEELRVGNVIDAALDVVRPGAEAKGVTLAVDIAARDDRVLGDAARLQQIIWNLLSNAVKFTPRGGTVRVWSRRAGSDIELGVEDSGEGIAPDFLPFVFDRFRQANSSSTRRHGGLGLGLAIVKQLVEVQGGTVRAHSEGAGKGATFVVKLPLRTASGVSAHKGMTPSHGMPPVAKPGAVFAGHKVLLVDDDGDARMLMEMLFTRRGADVVTAASVAEALARLEAFVPHVVVSDIGMPDEDGYALIAKLRALPEERGGKARAIALTGFAGEDDSARALQAGFDGYLAKPVESSALVALVGKLMS